jgi:hypothetical protein
MIDIKKKHLSVIIFRNYFSFIKDQNINISFDLFFSKLGLSKEYFENHANWVSVDFIKYFSEHLGKLNSEDFRTSVGQFGASEKGLGSLLHYMIKNTMSWEMGVKMAPRLNQLLNKVVKVDVINQTGNECVWSFEPIFKNLNDQQIVILNNYFEEVVQNIMGYYLGVAEMKELKNVHYELKEFQNPKRFVLTFNYQSNDDSCAVSNKKASSF